MRIPAAVHYWAGRAGLSVSVLLMGSSALLLLAGGALGVVIILGLLSVVMAVVALVLAYSWERSVMLEQGAQDLGNELGFRVIKVLLGEAQGEERDQYSVCFLETDGQTRAVQPAQQYAWRMWEKLRAQQLQISTLQSELANKKAGSSDSSTQVHEDGTIEIKRPVL